MTQEEVLLIMSKPRSAILIPQYRIIYKMATGTDWNKCMCGNGFNNFYRVCENYANAIKINLNKNN